MVRRRRRGTVIVDTPKGILVVNEGESTYYLPGGGARIGESGRNAAIRELLEETGLRATVVLIFLSILPISIFIRYS